MNAQCAEMEIPAGATDISTRCVIRIVYSKVHFANGFTGSGLFHVVSMTLHGHAIGVFGLHDLVCNHRSRFLWSDALFYHRASMGEL